MLTNEGYFPSLAIEPASPPCPHQQSADERIVEEYDYYNPLRT